MPLVKNALENRITAARQDRIGDVNYAAYILELVCNMSLEDYINKCVPDLPREDIDKLLKCLKLDAYEACYITFGEVCGLISEKWERLPKGTLPDEPLLEAMACLIPSPETEAF